MRDRGLFIKISAILGLIVSDFIALHINYSIPLIVVGCEPDHHIFASYSPGWLASTTACIYRKPHQPRYPASGTE